jgi:signal transduction histidine kinase
VDWILFGLRWLLMAVLVISILADNIVARNLDVSQPQSFALGVVAIMAVVNLGIAVLLWRGLWLAIFPAVVLLTDLFFAVAIYSVASGLRSSFEPLGLTVGPGLFVVATAGLRFGWIFGMIVAILISLSEAGLVTRFNFASPLPLDRLLPHSLILLTTSLLVGLVGEATRRGAIRRTHLERDAEEKRVRHIREQSRAIYKMASFVAGNLNFEKVLDAALDMASAGVADTGNAATQMVSAVLLFQDHLGAGREKDKRLYVATARRFTQADHRTVVRGKAGILAEAIEDGDVKFRSDPYRDPELSQFVAIAGCRSVMAVPLDAGLDRYGVIVFAHPRPDFFDRDHIELLEAVCKHTVIAVQNSKLSRRLMEEKERLVEVEEEARKKLARDLHDGPTQSVAALAMRANYTRRLLERDPKTASEELYKMEDLARRTTKEIRQMLFTLRPLVLESQGLSAALQSLADKMRETYELNVIVEAQPNAAEKLDSHAQGVLFYIAEEAVGNARKHAAARHVWVRLKLRNVEIFTLEIEDDGVGFNLGAVDSNYDKRGSLGMVNMRERTELVNGQLRIESAEGKGTKITVLVPLTENAKEKLLN